MFLHNELAAKRNHEEHAEPTANQGKHKDAGILKIEAQKHQRRKSKDDTGCDGLPGVSSGLNDVVFKNGRSTERPEDADGEHRDGDGSRYREASPKPDVYRNRAKDDSEE